MFALMNTTQVVNLYPGEIIDSTPDEIIDTPSPIKGMDFNGGKVEVTFENGNSYTYRIGAAVKVYFEV